MEDTISITREGGPSLRDILLGVTVGAVVLAIVVLLGLRLGVASETGTASALPRAGMPAPSFALPTSDGGMFSLAEAQGQPVWLTFWATWCPPCRVEMPDLQEVYRESPGRFRYVAANFGEEASVVRKFVEEIGYTLPVAMDPNADVAVQWGVLNLPTHFFIDSNGIVREVYAGALSRSQIEDRVGRLW